MLNFNDIHVILMKVRYLDWDWEVQRKGDGFLIQARWWAPDCHTGEQKRQHGRKWFISQHACISEVVQTAYAAVCRAVLHEVNEQFLYKGQRPFNPHFDLDALVDLDAGGNTETR